MRITKAWGALLLAGALLAAPLAAHCQAAPLTDIDLGRLLQGDREPLTHKLSDLDATWRRLSVSASADSANPGQAYLSLLSGTGMSDYYYTQGRTETVGGETYLVAYHRQTPSFDFAALMRSNAGPNNLPKPDPLTPDTVLSLSLLNLRTAGSLNDIRAFDIQLEIAASRKAASLTEDMGEQEASGNKSQASVSNLKQLCLGLLQYTQDNDENLPSLKDAATFKQAIFPYVKNDQVFVQPETGRPYKSNTSLTKRTLASFNEPATMVIFYEDAPDKDNTRAVAFLDGHVKRIPESEWPALKSASHVPGP